MRSTIALMGVGKLPSIELHPRVPAFYRRRVSYRPTSTRLASPTSCGSCLPAGILNQIYLHLTQRDFAVSICISITFHAFHQDLHLATGLLSDTNDRVLCGERLTR